MYTIKKNIISIIIAAIIIPFVAGIYNNTKDYAKVKDQLDELKTEIKELKTDLKEYQKDEWQRYVELNTNLMGQKYKLNKELGK